MENASKALLIAGGMLIALLTITLLVIMFNQIGGFYSSEENAEREEQIAKFNLEYEAYNREDVRGTDLLSLINKVINYNERKSEEGVEGADIGFQAINMTVKGLDISKLTSDGEEPQLITKSNYTIKEFKINVINKLNKLIGNFPGGENELIKLSKTINDSSSEEVRKYYEYVQFKRAHFKCTNVEYNKKTGRIIKMEFEFTGKFE